MSSALVRYYAVFNWGRERVVAQDDEEAMRKAKERPWQLVRLLKETKEILFDATHS